MAHPWSRPAARSALRAHVFVDDLDEPRLRDDDRHHLERVLRLGQGDELTASDGHGRVRPCRLGVELEPAGDVVLEERLRPLVTICFAPTKGERPEWAVQKLTELGVDRIVPFSSDRSVVRWEGERARRSVERFRRVAREAAMQSRRSFLPEVEELSGFEDVAALAGASLAHPDGDAPRLSRPTLLVGPEGGWSEAELARDMPRTGLVPRLLRTETAAVAGATLLCGLRSGVVSPNSSALGG